MFENLRLKEIFCNYFEFCRAKLKVFPFGETIEIFAFVD